MRFLLFYFVLLKSLVGSAQPNYDNFRINPQHPEPGKEILIEYSLPMASQKENIVALIFLNESKKKWPRAVEVVMQDQNDKYLVKVTPAPQDVSFMVIFIDTLGNVIDNNNDQGYWSPLFKEGESIPGSMASLANMFYGIARAEEYGIKPYRDLARSLYEEDFTREPELKRFYYNYYISSIRYEKEPNLWLEEINQYSSLRDLTDLEMQEISKKFASINDTTRAREYERLALERHPTGELALQKTSLAYQARYNESSNLAEKAAIYSEHRIRFKPWTLTEDMRRYLETAAIVTFLRNVDDYIRQGKLEDWKALIFSDSLRLKAQYYAYYWAAKRLNDKKIYPKQAAELAKEATEWREQSLDSPRIYTDWPYLSDREVRYNRENELSKWLEVYGHALRLQSKNEEARLVFEKAKLYAEHRGTRLRNRLPLKLIEVPLPPISFFDSDKRGVDLSLYRGKTIVLDLWASWCAPCIAGFKKMNELEKQFSKDSVVFLYVNTQEKRKESEVYKRAKEILQKEGYEFNVLFDLQNRSASHFDFNALPTIIVIDKKGVVRFKQTGLDDEQILEDVLTRLKTEN
jgi:thiol-disulfide isomerase/thioredoxin